MNTLLSLFAGDQAMAIRFLQEIRNAIPGQIVSFDQAVQTGDTVQAGLLMHGFKTQLRYTDAHDLARMAEDLEKIFDRAELPDVNDMRCFREDLAKWLDLVSATIVAWSGSINPAQ